MQNRIKHALWKLTNMYAYIFGFPALAPLNHFLALLHLHALGYDNRYSERLTGEYWFIKHILPAIGDAACIDIGANKGHYSLELTKHVQGSIYAVEPLSLTFAMLEKHAHPRVCPVKVAISDRDGTDTIYSRGAGAADASMHASHGDGLFKEQIQTLTLDTFVARQEIKNLGFVKIDTEGHEKEVLTGMQRTIRDQPPAFVQFEFNFGHLKRGHTLYMLTQLLPGYTFYRLMPHGMVYIEPDKYIDNLFMYSNIIAKRNDI